MYFLNFIIKLNNDSVVMQWSNQILIVVRLVQKWVVMMIFMDWLPKMCTV